MTNDLPEIVFGEQGVEAIVVTVVYLLPFALFIGNLYLIVHGTLRRKATGTAAPFPRILRIGSTCVLLIVLLYGCWGVSTAAGLAQGFADQRFQNALVECAVNNSLFLLVEAFVPAAMGYVGARTLKANKASATNAIWRREARAR